MEQLTPSVPLSAKSKKGEAFVEEKQRLKSCHNLFSPLSIFHGEGLGVRCFYASAVKLLLFFYRCPQSASIPSTNNYLNFAAN
jgi:hypothetical protein